MKKIIAVLFYVFVSISGWTQSSIVACTNSTGLEQALQLANSNFARKLDIGTNWTTIRIGAVLTVLSTGGNVTSSPQFAMGVCSGTNGLFLDAEGPTNFVGILSTNVTWTYSGSSYRMYTVMEAAATKVGTTVNTVSLLLNDRFQSITNATYTAYPNYRYIAVTITKGSPNYEIVGYQSDGSGHIAIADTLLLQMPLWDFSGAIGGFTVYTNTIPCDESAGPFDSVTIAWDRATPIIEILDLAVAKLQ